MSGPDPHALWISEDQPPFMVSYESYFWSGNAGNRRRRAIAMLKRLVGRDWICRQCGDPLPDWRRVDTRYCRESCRKKAARRRRVERQVK